MLFDFTLTIVESGIAISDIVPDNYQSIARISEAFFECYGEQREAKQKYQPPGVNMEPDNWYENITVSFTTKGCKEMTLLVGNEGVFESHSDTEEIKKAAWFFTQNFLSNVFSRLARIRETDDNTPNTTKKTSKPKKPGR